MVNTDELKKFTLQSVSQNCSFKALDASGGIIEVYINGITSKPVSGWGSLTNFHSHDLLFIFPSVLDIEWSSSQYGGYLQK